MNVLGGGTYCGGSKCAGGGIIGGGGSGGGIIAGGTIAGGTIVGGVTAIDAGMPDGPAFDDDGPCPSGTHQMRPCSSAFRS